MLKTIGLFKRRPGMSVEEFRAYYESTHRVIGEKYLKGHAERYVRRFLDPFPDRYTGEDVEPDFDVLLEIWYADREAYDATRAILRDPETAKEIAEDEEKLFDRESIRFFTVEEHESDLTA